jgi:hypothetical protein
MTAWAPATMHSPPNLFQKEIGRLGRLLKAQETLEAQ